MNAEFLLQIGFLMVLPIFAEEFIEFGLRYALGTQVRQQLSLRLVYTFFQERTKSVYFDRAMQTGEAKYIATGRSFEGMTSSFKEHIGTLKEWSKKIWSVLFLAAVARLQPLLPHPRLSPKHKPFAIVPSRSCWLTITAHVVYCVVYV